MLSWAGARETLQHGGGVTSGLRRYLHRLPNTGRRGVDDRARRLSRLRGLGRREFAHGLRIAARRFFSGLGGSLLRLLDGGCWSGRGGLGASDVHGHAERSARQKLEAVIQ